MMQKPNSKILECLVDVGVSINSVCVDPVVSWQPLKQKRMTLEYTREQSVGCFLGRALLLNTRELAE